jgi:hypothetical protein
MKSCSGINKFYLVLLALVLLFIAFVVSSFSGNTATISNPPTSTSTSTQATQEVDSIDLLINKIYPEIGLKILLMPKNDDGMLVEAEGNINITLSWQFGYGVEVTKGPLIQEWNIPITSEDYTHLTGVSIDLIYDEPISFGEISGFFDVTLTTPDGKILTAELPDYRETRC